MKIVIQCAGSKHEGAGHHKDNSRLEVIFVAHPEKFPRSNSTYRPCHPDAEIGNGLGTWRERLIRYNRQGTNPNNLYRAGDLYTHPVYRELVDRYGWENVFILSAGWGLIRSDFLIPPYDITFSNQGKPWSRRGPHDAFQDFNQLQDIEPVPDESIYFFGGQSYLPLYYSLTESRRARKVIYCSSPGSRQGYEYIHYRGFYNWHYSCAKDFMEGKVPM